MPAKDMRRIADTFNERKTEEATIVFLREVMRECQKIAEEGGNMANIDIGQCTEDVVNRSEEALRKEKYTVVVHETVMQVQW